MPYREPRLRRPGAPRTLVKGKYVILGLLGTLLAIGYAVSLMGRLR
jgi:hypothetical protein